MSDFINSLSNQTWFVTIVSFLAANIGTIVSMAVVIVRNKVKNDSMKKAFDEIIARANIQANQEFNQKVEDMKNQLISILVEQTTIIQKKLKIDSDARKEAITAKSIEVKDLIDSITKQAQDNLNNLDASKVGD